MYENLKIRYDENRVNLQISQIYESKGLTRPYILVFDSPPQVKVAYDIMILTLMGKNIANEFVHLNKHSPASILSKFGFEKGIDYEEVKKQICETLRDDRVDLKTWNSLREETKKELKTRAWNNLMLRKNKIKIFEYPFENYCHYSPMEGVYCGVFLRDFCIICKNPKYIFLDDRNRLHSLDGSAIEFEDKNSLYFVHSINFNSEFYRKVFIEKSFPPTKILSIKNIEQRAIVIEFYGYDKLIKELNAKRLDIYNDVSQVTSMPIECELYEFEIGRRTFRFVKVEDYSVHKVTTLGVPVIPETQTVKGAIAWTFGLNDSEYNPIIQT